MKSLRCSQCSGTRLKHRTSGEYECLYCGAIMLLDEKGQRLKPVRSKRARIAQRRRLAIGAAVGVLVLTALLTALMMMRKSPHSDHELDAGGVEGKPTEATATVGDFYPIRDGNDNIYFVGLVKNTGEAVLARPRVEITLFDEDGAKLRVEDGYADRINLQPQEEAPVKVLVSNAPDYHHHEAQIVPEVADFPQPSIRLGTRNVELERDTFRGYRLSGDVTNLSREPASSVQIIVLLYDAKDNIIGMDSGFIGRKLLNPGDTAPFSIRVSLVNGEPVRFKVYFSCEIQQDN